ncbi:MAG TPA: hypothetical protein VIJ79_01030 [Acidobacteriaceae bacterium]
MKMLKYIVVLALLSLFVLLAILFLTGPNHGKRDQAPGTEATAISTQSNVASDPLADMHATERRNYVQELNRLLDNGGLARDSDQVLNIKSPDLGTRAARDYLMSTTFDPRRLEGLCNIGFKSIRLYADTFGDATEYAVCKESKHAHDQRAQALFSQRQAFANNLAASFNSNPQVPQTSVEAVGPELVLTGKGLDPDFFRSNLPLMMGQDGTAGACSLGFTGLRVRPSSKVRGTFISYGCPR